MPVVINGSTGISGVDGSAGTPAFQGSDNNTGIRFGADIVSLVTGGSDRLYIDSSGRLLVGTSSARTLADAQHTVQIETTNYAALSLVNNTNDTGGCNFSLGKSRGTSAGGTTIVQSGDTLGAINFLGANGTNLSSYGAQIFAVVDATPGASDMPGRLVFSTTADGAASPTEAMRINNQRELLIGTTTRTANGGVLQVSNGITFPATQSACSDANTLDDYEEGTWTPIVYGTTTEGVATYSQQVGRYTKIGNLVYVFCYVGWTAHTGTGLLRIKGLPFTVQNISYGLPAMATFATNLTLAANNFLQPSLAADNTDQLQPRQGPVGGGTESQITLDTSAEIAICGSYRT